MSRFENIPSATARWVWDSTGTVIGATVNPTPEPAPSDHVGRETRAPLRLPFGPPENGSWYVAWGGNDAVHNYHVQAPDQRFASVYVVVDHGEGEHSLVAHFRRGSVAVQKGDEVEAGALLGECGNSGNSSLPHVHYHLQTGPAYEEGVGLPAQFEGYYVGGAYVEEGEPVRGQVVLPGDFE